MLTINKLLAGPLPFELLLLADETVEAIEKYVYTSDVYTVSIDDNEAPVAAFVLSRLNTTEAELKNIAVAPTFQGKGVGSILITEIREICRNSGFRKLWVGTPDSAIQQINFYEKNGFVRDGIKKNFFIDNYPDPIWEDGIMLKDMLMLCTEIC
jgi:ribosomal protein S18 acetylase RimI-like enzyme